MRRSRIKVIANVPVRRKTEKHVAEQDKEDDLSTVKEATTTENVNVQKVENEQVQTAAVSEHNLSPTRPQIQIISSINITDGCELLSPTHSKPPASPFKLLNRSRFKPTPRLGHRRNSTSASESEDDSSRRLHLNRSTTTSSQIPASPFEEVKIVSAATVTNEIDNADTEIVVPQKSIGYLPSKKKVRRSDIARKMAEAKRDFQLKFGTKTPDRQKLTMMDLIFYNPTANPMSVRTKKESKLVNNSVESSPTHDNELVDDPDNTNDEPIAVPQVKIGENGEIILDEQSLVIETSDSRKSRELTTTAINYDDLDMSYGIYKRAKRTKDWSKAETKQFYRVLQMIGTDFSMMLNYFTNRTRRDLKLKFKKEEKLNRHLIDKVLLNPCKFDLDALQTALDRDREAVRQQDEAERKLKEEKRLAAEKRKQSNVKRERYKTGSWFARQMYKEKREMTKSTDEDDDNDDNEKSSHDDINTQTKPPIKKLCAQDSDDECSRLTITDTEVNDEDESDVNVSKQLKNMFNNVTSRSGRRIKSTVDVFMNEFDQKTIVKENHVDSERIIIPDQITDDILLQANDANIKQAATAAAAAAVDTNKNTDNNLIVNQSTITETVNIELTTDQISILENYLGQNDSITIELPVVNNTVDT